jgi:hypothetical protein
MEALRNEFLWRKAKKRAGFKKHLQTYILVNAGLWLLYTLMFMQSGRHDFFPWPVWPMLGWGIGLTSHYFAAYGNHDERKLAEREYEKLLREQTNS